MATPQSTTMREISAFEFMEVLPMHMGKPRPKQTYHYLYPQVPTFENPQEVVLRQADGQRVMAPIIEPLPWNYYTDMTVPPTKNQYASCEEEAWQILPPKENYPSYQEFYTNPHVPCGNVQAVEGHWGPEPYWLEEYLPVHIIAGEPAGGAC